MMHWLWVIGFGIVGVSSRFAIDSWIAKFAFGFPVGTLAINIAGCLIAGFVFSAWGSRDLGSDPVRLGIVVGFCGGFTTFSGFGLQILQMFEDGRMPAAFAYGIATPVLCVLATGGGFFCARALV